MAGSTEVKMGFGMGDKGKSDYINKIQQQITIKKGGFVERSVF